MPSICPICKGTKVVKAVFHAKPIECANCRSAPDMLGRTFATGYVSDAKLRCPVCEGGGSIVGMGGMSKTTCSYCYGSGDVYESKIKADVEQIQQSYPKDSTPETNVGEGETDSNKRKRRTNRKESTVGISNNDIQECQESEQSSEESGCNESSQEQSSEQIQNKC